MIAFIALVVLSRFNVAIGPSEVSTIPYNLVIRTIPTANRAVDLLPGNVGSFKRGEVIGTIQNYKTTYTSGTDIIQIAGSQAVSFRAAQADVDQLAPSKLSGGAIHSLLDQDPSYVLNTSNLPAVRFSWSHDRWFFDVQANSQATLDMFMKGFKY